MREDERLSVADRTSMLRERLASMNSQVTAALRAMEGVHSVVAIGSFGTDRFDEYSDVDVEVKAAKVLDCARRRYEALLSVGPVAIEWIIGASPEHFASSILFANESPYHKVDLGFSALQVTRSAPQHAVDVEEPANVVHAQGIHTTYVPSPGSVGHWLVGQLIGGIRYVKARKRGHPFSCARFAYATFESLAMLVYEQASDWLEIDGKLNTWEYRDLDTIVDRTTWTRIASYLDFSSSEESDRNWLQLLDMMINLAGEKARIRQEMVDIRAVKWIREFIGQELQDQ